MYWYIPVVVIIGFVDAMLTSTYAAIVDPTVIAIYILIARAAIAIIHTVSIVPC